MIEYLLRPSPHPGTSFVFMCLAPRCISTVTARCFARDRWWLTALVLIAVGLTSHTTAQETAKSSPAAVKKYRAAVALQNQGMYDLAADEWSEFRQQHPEDPLFADASHYYGVCLFQGKQYKAAESAFQKSLDSDPSAELRPTVLLNLGLAQYNLGQETPASMERAVRTLEDLVKSFPDTRQAMTGGYYLAESLFATGQTSQAINRFEATLKQHPGHPQRDRLLYGLGVAQQKADKPNAARRSFDRLQRDFPESEFAVEGTVRIGEILMKKDQPEKALKKFHDVAESDAPLADYARLRESECYFLVRNYSAAAGGFDRLIEDFPRSEYVTEAALGAGKSHLLAGHHDQARQRLMQAYQEMGASAAEPVHWLARLELATEQPERALKGLERFLDEIKKDDPLAVQLKLDRADALYEIPGRRGDAEAAYAAIARQHPSAELAPQALYMAAFVALDKKRYPEANQYALDFAKRHRQHELTPDVLAILAESLLQTDRPSEARPIWEKLIDDYPEEQDRQNWITRVAICLNRQREHEAVIRWLRPRIRQIRLPAARSEAEYLLGSSWLHAGDVEKGVSLLKASLETAPNGPQAERALLLLGNSGKVPPAEAVASLDALLQKKPAADIRNRALLRKAELLYDAGEFGQAVTAYGQLARAAKSSNDAKLASEALLGMGWAQLDGEDLTAAIQTLTQLQESYAAVPDARSAVEQSYYVLAVACQQQGAFQQAVDQSQRFLATQPGPEAAADALYVEGLAHIGLQQWDRATARLKKIFTTCPEYPNGDSALYEMAWAFHESQQSEQAAEAFGRLASRYPGSSLAAESRFRTGEFLYEKERYDSAAEAYAATLKLAGKQPEIGDLARHKLGWCHFQQKRYTEAKSAFGEQLKFHPGSETRGIAVWMLAECAFELNDFEEALKRYRTARSEDISNETLQALGTLHAGQAAAELDQWQDAASWLEQCIKEFPNSEYIHEAQCELARAYQHLDKLELSRQLYEKVADATNTHVGARARFMLGELQFADKQFDEAIRTFFKVAYGYGHPDSPPAFHVWQSDAMFEAARCCESTKRMESARKLYSDLVKFFPNSNKAEIARKKLQSIGKITNS